MKSKKMFILAIIILILVIPIPYHLKDGGSIEYSAILYKVTKINRIRDTIDLDHDTFEKGIKIQILGIEIINSVK